MTTTYISIQEPCLSLEVDCLCANPATATVAALGAQVYVVPIRMADRIRLMAMTRDGSIIQGVFASITDTVTGFGSVAAADASGPIDLVHYSIVLRVTAPGGGHHIWPVLISTDAAGIKTYWYSTNGTGTLENVYQSGFVDPYTDPDCVEYGLTPPTGYESGLYLPRVGDRVEAAAAIGDVPQGTLGVMIQGDNAGQAVIVDWDDYPTGTCLLNELTVIHTDTVTPGTPPEPSENAPVISDVTATQSGPTTAVITWTTDVPTSSRVYYGETDSYGSQTVEDPTLTTDHSVTITGLTPGTEYHFAVQGRDTDGTVSISSDATVTPGIVWSDEGCKFSFAPEGEVPLEGDVTRQPLNPWVILRVSRDGGETFGPELWRHPGRIGQYKNRCIWRRLGQFRDGVLWIEVSDPCDWIIVDGYVQIRGDRS